jgi:hypothetical protein
MIRVIKAKDIRVTMGTQDNSGEEQLFKSNYFTSSI